MSHIWKIGNSAKERLETLSSIFQNVGANVLFVAIRALFM